MKRDGYRDRKPEREMAEERESKNTERERERMGMSLTLGTMYP
jgi:hypothetical protein